MNINGIGSTLPGAYSANVGKEVSEDTLFSETLEKAYTEQDKEKLKEACVQFESIMMSMMYKQMKATVHDGGLTDKSSARSMFEDMLDEELTDIAGQRGVGLADMMYKQLTARMDRVYQAKEENPASQTQVKEDDAASQIQGTAMVEQADQISESDQTE